VVPACYNPVLKPPRQLSVSSALAAFYSFLSAVNVTLGQQTYQKHYNDHQSSFCYTQSSQTSFHYYEAQYYIFHLSNSVMSLEFVFHLFLRESLDDEYVGHNSCPHHPLHYLQAAKKCVVLQMKPVANLVFDSGVFSDIK
jgi:hypothetical protein